MKVKSPKAGRLILPGVLAVEAVAIATGLIEYPQGLSAVLLIELTLAALVLVEITRAVLAVRAGKRDDVDWPTALEHGLSAVMPRRVAAMARHELLLWRALLLAVSRRTDVSGQETAIPYAGPLLPVLVAVLVVDGIGIVVLHLLLPWPAVRLAMLVVGVLGLVWLAGFLAGLRVYPHAVGPDRLRIRFGALREYRIRPADVTAVYRQRSWDISGMTAVLDGDLVVPVMNGTTVVVELAPGSSVGMSRLDETVDVRRVYFAADDPAAAVRAIAVSMPSAPER